MGVLTVLIIAICLGLLGIFFSIRAGVHSFQVSRRQASWPERRRLSDAGQRFFGLAFILMVAIVAGIVTLSTGNLTRSVLPTSPSASPEWTATTVPSKTRTSTPVYTSTPVPTLTPTLTPTLSLTLTGTALPSQIPSPSDTRWPSMTPSSTPPASLTPTPTWTPLPTSTLVPTHTLIPTDTHWPSPTPAGSK